MRVDPRHTSSTNWTHEGEAILLPATADVPSFLMPGGKYPHLVQRALDSAPKMPADQERGIWSVELNSVNLFPRTVLVGTNHLRTWAVHRDHMARRPGLSPFVTLSPQELQERRTNTVTLEMIRKAGKLLLVRAYPGDYSPPLPSMGSASQAVGGLKACTEYWHAYAYLVTQFYNRITPGSASQTPPDWYEGA